MNKKYFKLFTILTLLVVFAAAGITNISAGSTLVTQSDINNAISSYNLTSIQGQALNLINNYASSVTGLSVYSSKTPIIFAFEGAGSYKQLTKTVNPNHPKGRWGAMMVVVKNGKIVHIEKDASTLPDRPNDLQPGSSASDPKGYTPTVKSGIYRFVSGRHPTSGGYPAMHLQNQSGGSTVAVTRLGKDSTSDAIHIHRGRTDLNDAKSPTSQGCQIIAQNKYLAFAKSVGIVSSSVTSINNGDPYNSVNGIYVIDRTSTTKSNATWTYKNNATVSGDFFYVRDSNKNIISGKTIANGSRITVLNVDSETNLAYVEYLNSSGSVEKGYITNAAKLIKYDYQDQYKNGSTSEIVYNSSGSKIGSLNPNSTATPLYRNNGKLFIVYDTSKGSNTKSGYVVYNGKFTKF